MTLTAVQVAAVRDSFQSLAPQARTVAARFYAHLFEVDPSLRALFRSDLAHQGERLMQMIGAAVALLDRPAQLQPVLHALGQRHAGYGVQPAHYDRVGVALLRTLADGLGDAFTPALRDAWAAMYGWVAGEMQAAAQPLAA